jgi:hypothetical protein
VSRNDNMNSNQREEGRNRTGRNNGVNVDVAKRRNYWTPSGKLGKGLCKEDLNNKVRSRGSSDRIMSDYGLDDRAIGVRSRAEAKGFFLQHLCPDRLWGPLSLLSSGYQRSFPRGLSAAGS